MKILKLIGALVLSLALLGGGYDGVQAQIWNDLVSEDDAYDSSFSGPLIYCRRADTALALADDAETMPILCDNEGKLYTTAAGGSGGAVTNAGVFAVQEDGAALTAQQAIQTATEAINTKLVTGTVIGDVNSILAVGLLHANSPTTVAAIVKVFNAGDIAATSMGASTAITITGTGALTKVCVILTTGTITSAENGDLIFFTTDPTISENTADLTVVKAKQISSIISLTGTDFTTDFATAQVNCQKVDEPFTALTHVLWHAKGATAYTDEVIDVLVTYRRDS